MKNDIKKLAWLFGFCLIVILAYETTNKLADIMVSLIPAQEKEIAPTTEQRVTDLEIYKKSTEPIISRLNDECRGHAEELRELRAITDEFRAQIKGLQKEVLIGIQEGYNGQ